MLNVKNYKTPTKKMLIGKRMVLEKDLMMYPGKTWQSCSLFRIMSPFKRKTYKF